VKLKSILIAVLALAGASATAAEFHPLVNASLLGGAAATAGGSSSSLVLLDLSVVPSFKFGSRSLLPVITAGTGGQERSISEGTTFVRTAQAEFKPSLRTQLAGDRSYTLRLDAQRHWNKETLGEEFGNGFYDYDQFGLGGSFDLPASDLGFSLSLGADFGHRNYPNNHNIAAAAALLGGKNYYLKDYYVTAGQATVGFDFHHMRLSYRPELHSYTDSYVVGEKGLTDLNTLQQDWLHTLDLSLSFKPSETVALYVGLDLSRNASNQNFVDFNVTPNKVVLAYQDYYSESLSFSLPWTADRLWSGLTLAPSYSLVLRQTEKPVQDASGAYSSSDEKQGDTEHNLGLNISKGLPWGLAWVSDGNYKIVRSNQVLVRGTLNNYEYWQVTTGLSYAFQGEGSSSKAAVEPGMDDPEFGDKVADPLHAPTTKATPEAGKN
jgi:hypothetical protein